MADLRNAIGIGVAMAMFGCGTIMLNPLKGVDCSALNYAVPQALWTLFLGALVAVVMGGMVACVMCARKE